MRSKCCTMLLVALLCVLAGLPGLQAADKQTLLALPLASKQSFGLDVMAVAGAMRQRGYDIIAAAGAADVPLFVAAADRASRQTPATAAAVGSLTFVPVTVTESEMQGLLTVTLDPCKGLVTNATAMQMLREARPALILSYDSPWGTDSCPCLLSHALGVPYLLLDSHPFIFPPITLPQFRSKLVPSSVHGPIGFTTNAFYWAMTRALRMVAPWFAISWGDLRKAAGVKGMKSYGGCRPAAHLHLKSFLVEYPQQLEPGHLMVGPVSPAPPAPADQQPLTQPEVWEFLQSADPAEGVVLVGFGYQNLTDDAGLMRDEWRMLAEALTALAPAKVLWVLDTSKLPSSVKIGEGDYAVGPNVLVVPWVDYNDVLGHPATRLFITHCGSHSCYEAAFHGVPVMALPFSTEQGEMAMRMLAAGLGYAVPEAVAFRATGQMGGLTKGMLVGIAKQVMESPRFHETAASTSAKLQKAASLRSPLQLAADEVEVTLRMRTDSSASASTSSSSSGGGESAPAAVQAEEQEQAEDGSDTQDDKVEL